MRRCFGRLMSLPAFGKPSLRPASTRAAIRPASCGLVIRPPAASAAREAPTPLIFTSGLTHPASAWEERTGLPAAAAALGYTVGLLDLPGYGLAPSGWQLDKDLGDELAADLRVAISSLHAAPVVIAPSVVGQLMQKYLESFPLAGLVMVSPLPPDPAALLRRLTRAGSEDRVEARKVLAALRRAAATEESAAALWLSGEGAEEQDVAALAACVEALSAPEGGDEAGPGARVCGFPAAAEWLARLCVEPVNLEPQPVPTIAVFGEHDRLVNDSDRQAILDANELSPGTASNAAGPLLAIGAGAAAERAAFIPELAAGDAQTCVIAGAGHDILHGSSEARDALQELILAWAARRF